MRPHRPLLAVAFATSFCAAVAAVPLEAQEHYESTEAVVARVRQGGVFYTPKCRRGDDGMLQVDYLAQFGGSEPTQFLPLLGESMADGFASCGIAGWLALFCHGNGDLLSMTDTSLHFQFLGIDSSDAGLRQFLAAPLPSFAGAKGRAELLDRMLAIDVLSRRGCKAAAVELQNLAERQDAPRPLQKRAADALDALTGRPSVQPQHRLDPNQLSLPLAFDGCLVIEHSRLPDLGWLTAWGRRLSMLVTARTLAAVNGDVSAEMLSGGQRFYDALGELPFAAALQFGNARFGESCVIVVVKPGEPVPFALRFCAAGEIEAEGWQQATLPADFRSGRGLQIPDGSVEIEPDLVQACLGVVLGRPRPEQARELLRDTGAALRVVIPAASTLWLALAAMQLPPAEGADLRITFGAVATIRLDLTARDEVAAVAWVEQGKARLLQTRKELLGDREFAERLQQLPGMKIVFDAVSAAQLTTDGRLATATIEIRGMDQRLFQQLLESLRLWMW